MRHGGLAEVATFDEIKIARRVGAQVQAELVVMITDGNVIVEVLIKIRFAVLIEIVETRDLVATENINLFIHNLEAEWLKEPSGVTSPF